MTSINLLPWRETLRKERLQQFITSLGFAAGLAVAIVVAVHMQFSGMIRHQESRNGFLEQQVLRVEKQIKEIEAIEKEKKSLLARMNVIQQLQEGRPQIVHVFDELVRTLPEGVYLTKIKQGGDTVALEGIAQSNARVSTYMRNLDSSDWFTNPRLSVIEAADAKSKLSERSAKFSLNVGLSNPLKKNEEAG